MSKPRKDLSTDCSSLQKYVSWLGANKNVVSVYLAGSRSPLRSKQHKEDSDWDLVVFTKLKKLKFPNPRNQFKIHVDLLVVHDSKVDRYKKSVQLWPEDTHKVFE